MFNIKVIHIEVSSKCTLKCPRCPRTELSPDSLHREISLAEFKQAFPVHVLTNVNKIIFCGDIGDPIYAKEFIPICAYIKSNSDTTIHIVTNGSYKNSDWWTSLGQVLTASDQITFSVDGWDFQSNNQYRINADFDSILIGARTLRATSKCIMNWSSIYFSFNEDNMDQIKALAQSLGFDSFQTVKSTKFDNRYAINGLDPLKPKNISNTGVYERSSVSLTNRTIPIIDYTINKHAWARCLNHKKELFINVDGLVFPCPWFNSGYQQNSFVQQHQHRLSIKTRSLTEVLQDDVWAELVQSFDSNPLEVCKIKCKHG